MPANLSRGIQKHKYVTHCKKRITTMPIRKIDNSVKKFEHEGKEYTLQLIKIDPKRKIRVFDGDNVVGEIVTKHMERAIWVIRKGQRTQCIRTPKNGMRRPQIIDSYLRALVDPSYEIPDITKIQDWRPNVWLVSLFD